VDVWVLYITTPRTVSYVFNLRGCFGCFAQPRFTWGTSLGSRWPPLYQRKMPPVWFLASSPGTPMISDAEHMVAMPDACNMRHENDSSTQSWYRVPLARIICRFAPNCRMPRCAPREMRADLRFGLALGLGLGLEKADRPLLGANCAGAKVMFLGHAGDVALT